MKRESPFRMMDANLNRVAEGLRVVEDVLRFSFEDKDQSEKARLLRHEIRKLFGSQTIQLLSERNVKSDPGLQTSQEHNLDTKSSWQDILLANLKRAQEGLRVLEESAHLLNDRNLAKQIELKRFMVYELEYQITKHFGTAEFGSEKVEITKEGMKRKLPAGIYALTSEPHSLGRTNLKVAEEILKAGVKILQYREKNKKQGEMFLECQALRKMTREAGAIFIVNDHIEIAKAVGADGVHIGQDDLPVQTVRQLLGPDMIIGVSTHSPEQAQAAVQDGADYIGVGPVFATQTKTDVCAPVGLDYLRYVVNHLEIPFVAIGGIKEHNLAEVVSEGAKTVALVTEIVGSPDISGKIAVLQEIMANAVSQRKL